MHKCVQLKTPQKKSLPDLKELSPLPHLLSYHHKSSKLQILYSPATPHRDLFNQLLVVDPVRSPNQAESQMFNPLDYDFQIMQEESSSYSQYHSDQNDFQDFNEDELSLDQNDDDDESGLKKRKRKSTAQIKILKAELERQPNWSKEKIVEMSDQTGLSQSQVYKWWWDQKKKTARHEKQGLADKRKMIKKQSFKKGPPYDKHSQPYYIDDSLLTKPKSAIQIEEVPQTEKKINKRLVFL